MAAVWYDQRSRNDGRHACPVNRHRTLTLLEIAPRPLGSFHNLRKSLGRDNCAMLSGKYFNSLNIPKCLLPTSTRSKFKVNSHTRGTSVVVPPQFLVRKSAGLHGTSISRRDVPVMMRSVSVLTRSLRRLRILDRSAAAWIFHSFRALRNEHDCFREIYPEI